MDLNLLAIPVQHILRTLSYSDLHQTLEHVMQVLRAYGGLRVESKYFVVNNGVEAPTKLLSITGTIPVKCGRESCLVGVMIWVPKSYPSEDPQIFLIPKSKSAEELPEVVDIDDQPKCQVIDVHGKVDIFELRYLFIKINKNLKEPCNLAQLIDVLVVALSKWTPPEFIAPESQRSVFNSRFTVTSSSVRTPWRLATTSEDLTAKLVHHCYKNVEQTAIHILAATARFPTLNPFLNEFVHNNGTAEKLVTVSGVLQLQNEGGNFYNLQILIWLPKTYPAEDSVVFVKFINDDISSRITRLDYMDRFGKVDFRICKFKRSSLIELIEKLLEKWRADLFDGDSDSDDEVVVITAKSCLSGRSPFPKRVDKFVDAQSRSEASTPAVSAEPQRVSVTATCSRSSIEPSAFGNEKMDQNQQPENHSMQTVSNDACVICEDPSEVIGTGQDAPLSEDEANQLMTLCRNMMPNQNDIPKVIRREMFPFCAPCKELAKELWECEVKMEKIKAKIESKVVEEVNLSGDPIHSEEANNGNRFMKLRSAIYEGYRNKLRLKKKERLAGKTAATANPTPSIISSENNGKPAEKNSMEEENSRYQLPLEVERSVTVESMVDLKVEEESRSDAEEQEFGDLLFEVEYTTVKAEAQPENTDEQVVSLNAAVSVPRTRSGSARPSEGTLMVEAEGASVKLIWTKDLSTSAVFVECSFENCNHSVPFGTTIEEMNDAYESSQEHIQRNHKKETDLLAKRFGKQQHFQCPLYPTCKLMFADSVSTDKHEIIHRSCGHCGKKVGKIAFYKNPSLMLSHKCLQNNAEKRNGSADQGPSRRLRNKRFKYVP